MTAPIAAVRRWEELGQQLQKTVTTYLNLCTALELSLSGYPNGASDLISKIDDRLHGFDDLLVRLNSARSSLTRTRNKLKAPILRLPGEIMSSIFHMAINIAELETTEQRATRNLLQTRYRHLHALLSVCSSWRRLIISHGTFWSIVPVFPQKNDRYMPTAAQLSLERSTGCGLHLVAELFMRRPDISNFVSSLLTCYGPRFRTINLKADYGSIMNQAISVLLTSTTNAPGLLDELSMCFHHGQIGRASNFFYLTLLNNSQQAAFKRMLGSLCVLKLRGLRIDFIGVSFVSLAQLRVQDIRFDDHTRVAEILWALSSSTQVNTLELISVTAFSNTPEVPSSNKPPVSLPTLRFLYLEDLFQDMLNFVLAWIEPRHHRVTLNLTSSCSRRCGSTGVDVVGLAGLRFQDSRIDTLMLTPRFGDAIDGSVRTLLRLMPTVSSLHIDGYQLGSNYLRQLIRLPDPGYIFPHLTKLHISRSLVSPGDLDILKEVVSSHAIESLGLGLIVSWLEGGITQRSHFQNPHEQYDPVRNWLLDATPLVSWLPDNLTANPPAPEFESGVW
ncbi:hypothetical protein FRC11_012620 [Ceratobasidium sp. 423]|nr:hypothetical protein FRC11_012620 [Ceratobasidium sp. 423]